MRNKLLEIAAQSSLKADPPKFTVGDTVDVYVRIVEGDKERIQIFNGTVLARRGAGISESFIVRRIVNGEGVERTFPVHSPKIEKVEVRRSGRVARAKIYYLRDRVGKRTKLRERAAKVPGPAASSQDDGQPAGQPAMAAN